MGVSSDKSMSTLAFGSILSDIRLTCIFDLPKVECSVGGKDIRESASAALLSDPALYLISYLNWESISI